MGNSCGEAQEADGQRAVSSTGDPETEAGGVEGRLSAWGKI